MKQTFILLVVLLAIRANGQITVKDSTLKVVYANKTSNAAAQAWFINGKFSGQVTLDPAIIDNIDIVKGEIQIDGVQYNGQIHIKTKSSYSPKFITLSALKDKYTNLKNRPAVFMINENFINADYDKYIVDESYLLQIVVDNIKNAKENIDLGLIKLITKTPENIKKSKEIILRGGDVAASK